MSSDLHMNFVERPQPQLNKYYNNHNKPTLPSGCTQPFCFCFSKIHLGVWCCESISTELKLPLCGEQLRKLQD